MAVHAVEHQPAAVQGEHSVPDLHPAEAEIVGNALRHPAFFCVNRQFQLVQLRAVMVPAADFVKRPGGAVPVIALAGQLQRLIQENPVLRMGDFRPYRGNALNLQPQIQLSLVLFREEGGPDPQILHMGRRLSVQEHRSENAREPEKVLILQPGGGAALMHLNAQPVPGGADAGRQVEIRGGEGILAVADELSVQPHIGRLLNALEGNAHPFVHQPRVQIKLADIAAHRVVLPVNLRRMQRGMTVPGIELIDVLDLSEALGFHVSGHGDGAELSQVIIFLPEIRRAGVRVGTPAEQPLPVQVLTQGGLPCPGLLDGRIADVVGMGRQPVYLKNSGICQPVELSLHGAFSFSGNDDSFSISKEPPFVNVQYSPVSGTLRPRIFSVGQARGPLCIPGKTPVDFPKLPCSFS